MQLDQTLAGQLLPHICMVEQGLSLHEAKVEKLRRTARRKHGDQLLEMSEGWDERGSTSLGVSLLGSSKRFDCFR